MPALRLLAPLSRLRQALRFRLWAWRTRLKLARLGCRFELVAPHGAAFETPPDVVPSLQLRDRVGHGGGHLRLEIGREAHFGRDVTIEVLPGGENLLALGDGVVCLARSKFMLFGGRVEVGAWSFVGDGALLKSSGRLRLGEHVNLKPYASIQADTEVVLEDHVVLSERVTVVDSDHTPDGSDDPFLARPVVSESIHIGRNSFVATNSVVMRGVRLGRNSLVAAGSVVVAGDYPAGWLIVGAPATARRELTEREGETLDREAG